MTTKHDDLVEAAFAAVGEENPLSHLTRSDLRDWVELFESLGVNMTVTKGE